MEPLASGDKSPRLAEPSKVFRDSHSFGKGTQAYPHTHRPMAKTEANMELSYSPDLGDTLCLPDQATGQGQVRGPSPLSLL